MSPNIDAIDYMDIINWYNCSCVHLIFWKVCGDDIKSLINVNTNTIKDIKKFPCYIYTVKR